MQLKLRRTEAANDIFITQLCRNVNDLINRRCLYGSGWKIESSDVSVIVQRPRECLRHIQPEVDLRGELNNDIIKQLKA